MIINDNVKRLVLSLGDFATSQVIGTAVNTVDRASSFSIAQTTSWITLTLPNPTDNSAWDMVILTNTGTATFSVSGVDISPSSYIELMWNWAGWVHSSSGSTGDKNYTITFSGTSSLVPHNLNKYPSIQVYDASLMEIEAEITHIDLNNSSITINSPISGTIICN